MTNITSSAGAFTYRYFGGGGQVRELALPNGATESRLYDAAGRVRRLAVNNSSGTTLDYHSYYYDLAGLRKQETRLDGSQVAYDYDAAGQLTAAKAFYDDGTVRPHEWSEWAYDAAGNLTNRVRNALNQSFSVNSLNQLVSGSRSGTLTVAGLTSSTVTNVTVNGQTATRYRDGTFAKAGFSLSDGTNTFTAIATDSGGANATNEVSVNLPANPGYSYDLNGNLTSDATKGFEYDDENQLTRITVTNAWKSEFAYDGKMRRRIRKEFTWTGGAWVLTEEVRYLYDGKLVIEERDGSNVPVVTYTRGRDKSGGLERAGGIGGLLGRTARGTTNSHAFYHSDAIGNVTILLDSSQGVAARYLYDPFGQAIAQWGTLAAANLYRFSSKEAHERSGLVYYLYRYYAPELQRWLNRDPITERGGLNLYALVKNHPITAIDAFGHKLWRCVTKTFGGMAWHAYLWDDRADAPATKRVCEENGSLGIRTVSLDTPSEGRGPIIEDGILSNGSTTNDRFGTWFGVSKAGASCACSPVEGTEGQEAELIDRCNLKIDSRFYFPLISDCHTAVDSFLKKIGRPPTLRLGRF